MEDMLDIKTENELTVKLEPSEIFIKSEDLWDEDAAEDDTYENISVDPLHDCNSSASGSSSGDQIMNDVSSSKEGTKGKRKVISNSLKSEENDLICQLIRHPFSTRSLSEQREIVKQGRPSLSVTKVGHTDSKSGKVFARYLSGSAYSQYDWLTLSEARCKLFCWACLLFPVKGNLWNQDGYFDLKNVTRCASHHSETKHHIMSCIALKRFKNEQFRKNVSVKKTVDVNEIADNREVFKRILDSSMLCIRQNRTIGSLEVCDYLFRHSNELKRIWSKLRQEPEVLNRVLNCIFSALNRLVQQSIHDALQNADFFSIIVDQHPNGCCSIVVRFVDKKDVTERCLGLFAMNDRTAESLFRTIDSTLTKYSYATKLVAHCYSGGCLTVDQISAMQTSIEIAAPQSLYVNCSYHSVCETLADGACTTLAETLPFFSSLRLFPRFLIEVLKKTTNESLVIKLSPNSGVKSTISFISENREGLISFLKDIKDLDHDTMSRSRYYAELFQKSEFLCLLVTYKELFERIGDLDLSRERMGHMSYSNTINDVLTITKMSECAITGLKELENMNGVLLFLNSLASLGLKGSENDFRLFKNCVTNANMNLENRYSSKLICPLTFFELLDVRRFDSYVTQFPKVTFKLFTDKFGKVLNCAQLKGELEVVYSDPAFRCDSLVELTGAIMAGNLSDVLPETLKFLTLARSFPPTTGCTTAVTVSTSGLQKSINKFLNTGFPKELASVYIHKDILIEMEKSLEWYDDVMKQFVQSQFSDCLQLFLKTDVPSVSQSKEN